MTITYKRPRRVVDNTGNVSVITLDFPVENPTDVSVYVGDPGLFKLSLGTHYSVEGAGSDSVSIAILNPTGWGEYGAYAVEARYIVDQPNDVDTGGTFGARFERALDRMARMVQTVSDRVDRSVSMPPTTSTNYDPVLIGAPDQLIGWDETGTMIVNRPTVSQSINEAEEAAEEAAEFAAASAASAMAALAAANAGFVFNTQTSFQNSVVPAPLQFVEVAGYSLAGQGGSHRKFSIPAPGAPKLWQSQSLDGKWWEIDKTDARPSALGAVGDGVVNDTAVFTALEQWVSGQYIDLESRRYYVDSIPIGNTYLNGEWVSASETPLNQNNLNELPWVKSRVTITGSNDTMVATAVNGTHYLSINGLTVADGAFAAKFQAAPAGYNYARIRLSDTAENFIDAALVHLPTGTVTAFGSFNSVEVGPADGNGFRTIRALKNGIDVKVVNVQLWVYDNAGNSGFTGDGVSGIKIKGFTSGSVSPSDDGNGTITGVSTTGGTGTPYNGGANNTPTVSGRSTRERVAIIASQNCKSEFQMAVNVGSIYSWAYGNVSANVASRQSVAGCPQAVNLAAEEGQVYGFGGANVNVQFCLTDGTKCGNYNARLSFASSARYAGNFSTNTSKAGGGYGAILVPVFTSDGGGLYRITAVNIVSGGSGYDLDHEMFYTARQTQPVEAMPSSGVNTGNSTITTQNNTLRWVTGMPTVYKTANGSSSPTSPDRIGGLVPGTTYYVIRVGTTAIRLATSKANAIAGTFIPLTSQGVGDHVFSCEASFSFTVNGTGTITAVTVLSEGRGYVATEYGDMRVQYPADGFGECAVNVGTIATYTKGRAGATIGSTSTDNYGDASVAAASNGGGSTAKGKVRQVLLGASGGVTTNDGAMVLGGSLNQATGLDAAVMGRRTINPTDRTIAGGDNAGGSASSANRKWEINHVNGQFKSVTTFAASGTFADFGEYFENKKKGVIPYGTIVMLAGDKIAPWDSKGAILGVVSATVAFMGNDADFQWQGRYLKGDFGEELKDADGNPIENPDYDPKREHVARSKRPAEWSPVGLVGQVFTRVPENTKPGDFIGGKLRVMKVTKLFSQKEGYAVALCFIR